MMASKNGLFAPNIRLLAKKRLKQVELPIAGGS